MLTSIIYKSNLLIGLFSEEDIDFLKANNGQKSEMESSIQLTDFKKDKIFQYIKQFDSPDVIVKDSDESIAFTSLRLAQTASQSADLKLQNLTNILDEFNDIEKDVVELAVRKESMELSEMQSTIASLNVRISTFKNNKYKCEAENEKYNSDIDNFFTKFDRGSLYKPHSACLPMETEEEKELDEPISSLTSKDTMKVFNVYSIDFKDNLELKISEKDQKVYLPYTKQDIQDFLDDYPEEYISAKDVVDKEFTEKISMYNKHPSLARFREAYYLSKYKEMNSSISSLKFARGLMFRRDLNPTIVAAVRSKKELEDYIDCLDNNNLEDFKHFKITFEVNPSHGCFLP